MTVLNKNTVTKTHSTHLTDGTLFTFTGTIEIEQLVGEITTAIEAGANTLKFSIVSDALAAYDICTATDIAGMGIGTLLSITGTANGALVATTLLGAKAPGQVNPVVATCITSGAITATYSATGTKDGVIVYQLRWRPISQGATCVAA